VTDQPQSVDPQTIGWAMAECVDRARTNDIQFPESLPEELKGAAASIKGALRAAEDASKQLMEGSPPKSAQVIELLEAVKTAILAVQEIRSRQYVVSEDLDKSLHELLIPIGQAAALLDLADLRWSTARLCVDFVNDLRIFYDRRLGAFATNEKREAYLQIKEVFRDLGNELHATPAGDPECEMSLLAKRLVQSAQGTQGLDAFFREDFGQTYKEIKTWLVRLESAGQLARLRRPQGADDVEGPQSPGDVALSHCGLLESLIKRGSKPMGIAFDDLCGAARWLATGVDDRQLPVSRAQSGAFILGTVVGLVDAFASDMNAKTRQALAQFRRFAESLMPPLDDREAVMVMAGIARGAAVEMMAMFPPGGADPYATKVATASIYAVGRGIVERDMDWNKLSVAADGLDRATSGVMAALHMIRGDARHRFESLASRARGIALVLAKKGAGVPDAAAAVDLALPPPRPITPTMEAPDEPVVGVPVEPAMTPTFMQSYLLDIVVGWVIAWYVLRWVFHVESVAFVFVMAIIVGGWVGWCVGVFQAPLRMLMGSPSMQKRIQGLLLGLFVCLPWYLLGITAAALLATGRVIDPKQLLSIVGLLAVFAPAGVRGRGVGR